LRTRLTLPVRIRKQIQEKFIGSATLRVENRTYRVKSSLNKLGEVVLSDSGSLQHPRQANMKKLALKQTGSERSLKRSKQPRKWLGNQS
jgi:hypothetical protein